MGIPSIGSLGSEQPQEDAVSPGRAEAAVLVSRPIGFAPCAGFMAVIGLGVVWYCTTSYKPPERQLRLSPSISTGRKISTV